MTDETQVRDQLLQEIDELLEDADPELEERADLMLTDAPSTELLTVDARHTEEEPRRSAERINHERPRRPRQRR